MEVLYTLLTFIAFSFLGLFLALCFIMLTMLMGKSIGNPEYAPVTGTVFNQLFHFNKLHDFHAEMAKTHPTFRLLASDQSQLYTIDTRNVEHILKTKFDKYSKGKYDLHIKTDLFGEGIFTVDGDKWRQQRKLASYEFSTRVLRDFSCSVFRRNAAKLVRVVSGYSHEGLVFYMQDLLMRCTLDSIFKVGFGTELNCLEGSSKEGTEFMKAFDESNALVYWRYVDTFWRLKRFLNIGCEATLKRNVKLIDDFVHGVIKARKAQWAIQQDSNVKEDILSRFLMESKKDPTTMTDQYLRDIILNFMIAGKDTSANTLSWTAEAPDILPDSHKVKKGDGVYYLAYGMGGMSSIWGEDAEEFHPERWLNNGIFPPESPFKFVAFYAGPRICLGKDFAYRQMKIVAMALLQFFMFKQPNETQNMTYRVMFTLHIDKGLPLYAVPRS